MFDNLTERLSSSLRAISGSARLNEDNIKDTLREVRMALLEADVALPVVKDFIERIKVSALGQEVLTQLQPGQAFVKIVHEELVRTLGAWDLVLRPAAYALYEYALPRLLQFLRGRQRSTAAE